MRTVRRVVVGKVLGFRLQAGFWRKRSSSVGSEQDTQAQQSTLSVGRREMGKREQEGRERMEDWRKEIEGESEKGEEEASHGKERKKRNTKKRRE